MSCLWYQKHSIDIVDDISTQYRYKVSTPKIDTNRAKRQC